MKQMSQPSIFGFPADGRSTLPKKRGNNVTTQEMMKTQAKPGYWFVNVSAVGENPDWREQLVPLIATNTLFGYDLDAFMAKQYK